MIHKYDEAVVSLFRKLFDDNRIHVSPPEQAIRFVAQLEDDNVKFPLISINRTNWSIRSGDINWSASRMGLPDSLNSNNTANILHVIPIRIEYQLDVYTVDRVTNDEILRELIFYILLHPTLKVNIPYGLESEHVFNLFFNDDITDNSDTVEHINKGVLYRTTATFYTDDAYLFAKTKANVVVPRMSVNINENTTSYTKSDKK